MCTRYVWMDVVGVGIRRARLSANSWRYYKLLRASFETYPRCPPRVVSCRGVSRNGRFCRNENFEQANHQSSIVRCFSVFHGRLLPRRRCAAARQQTVHAVCGYTHLSLQQSSRSGEVWVCVCICSCYFQPGLRLNLDLRCLFRFVLSLFSLPRS